MSPNGSPWDPTLYSGSARHYLRGRLPYSPVLASFLADVAELDGSGLMLDLGCGPGTLSIELAHLFGRVVGVDPDEGMIAAARSLAAERGLANVEFVNQTAEDFAVSPATVRMATFGQSFHWMDQPLVASHLREMLEPGGHVALITDAKDFVPEGSGRFPLPPMESIRELVRSYLGPGRRAGQTLLQNGPPDTEEEVLKQAGFEGPMSYRVPGTEIVIRDVEDVVSWVYSRSDSAPHLFAKGLDDFDQDLRELLTQTSVEGKFAEPIPDTHIRLWSNPMTK